MFMKSVCGFLFQWIFFGGSGFGGSYTGFINKLGSSVFSSIFENVCVNLVLFLLYVFDETNEIILARGLWCL